MGAQDGLGDMTLSQIGHHVGLRVSLNLQGKTVGGASFEAEASRAGSCTASRAGRTWCRGDVAGRVRAEQAPEHQTTAVDQAVRALVLAGRPKLRSRATGSSTAQRSTTRADIATLCAPATRLGDDPRARPPCTPDLANPMAAIGGSRAARSPLRAASGRRRGADQYPAAASGDPSRR